MLKSSPSASVDKLHLYKHVLLLLVHIVQIVIMSFAGKRTIWVFIVKRAMVVFSLVLCAFMLWNMRPEPFIAIKGTKGLAHVNNSMNFEPDVYDDIQTVESEYPRIPHIIHFVFVTYETDEPNIPEFYKSNAASFVHFNPDWTFTLWTMKLGRQLIAAKHPDLLSTWDNYIDEIKMADALRYVLLYEFGGVYTDLDTICRRNLDRATMKYACILTPEPFEHSALLYRYPFMICNGYMMCRPNHPLMKQAIASLKYSASEDTVLDIAGPLFLTRQFKQYNNIQPADSNRTKLYNESNSPYFYKGWRREDDFNGVYIANTHYFMRYVDPTIKFYDLCKEPLSQLAKRGCFVWHYNQNRSNSFSYTDHLWRHLYFIHSKVKMVSIKSVVPETNLRFWSP